MEHTVPTSTVRVVYDADQPAPLQLTYTDAMPTITVGTGTAADGDAMMSLVSWLQSVAKTAPHSDEPGAELGDVYWLGYHDGVSATAGALLNGIRPADLPDEVRVDLRDAITHHVTERRIEDVLWLLDIAANGPGLTAKGAAAVRDSLLGKGGEQR